MKEDPKPSDQDDIEEFLSNWEDELQALIDEHSRWNYRKYENLPHFVTDVQFDPLEDKITSRFQEEQKGQYASPVFTPAVLLSSLPTDP